MLMADKWAGLCPWKKLDREQNFLDIQGRYEFHNETWRLSLRLKNLGLDGVYKGS